MSTLRVGQVYAWIEDSKEPGWLQVCITSIDDWSVHYVAWVISRSLPDAPNAHLVLRGTTLEDFQARVGKLLYDPITSGEPPEDWSDETGIHGEVEAPLAESGA